MKQITPWSDRPEMLAIPDDVIWGDAQQEVADKSMRDEIKELRAALTEAQLKQYGRDVLEEAAKICDAEVQDIHSSDESRNTAEHFASSIRALIKEIE